MFTAYPPDCNDYGIVSSLHSVEAGGFFFASWTCSGTTMGFGIVDHIDGKYKNIDHAAPGLNTWTHYVFTVDYIMGGDPIIKMYQDGIFLGAKSVGFWATGDKPPTSNPRNELVFGSRFVNVQENLDTVIDIDEVLLFDYSLEQSDVTLIFNA